MKSINNQRTVFSLPIAVIFAVLAAGSDKDVDSKVEAPKPPEPEIDRSAFAQFKVGEKVTLVANSIGCYSSRDLEKVVMHLQDGREADVEEMIQDKDCNVFQRPVTVTYVEYPRYPKGPVWVQMPSELNIYVYEAFLKRKRTPSGKN